MHIYRGIDTIVHRLLANLVESDEYFTYAKFMQIGSISSNTKVSLPQEAYYLLEIPDDRISKNRSFFGW